MSHRTDWFRSMRSDEGDLELVTNLEGLNDFLVVYWHDDRDRFLPENRETVRNVGCQSSVVFVESTRWVELSEMSDEIGHGD